MKDIREKNYSKEELKESLFEYLSLDLQTIMEKRKEPLIVFIDTYEKYFNSFIKDKVRLSNEEEWLRKLIDEVPYVLWGISGRENIEKNDEENWTKIVPSLNEINCFTEDEIKRYMTNVDVDITLLPLFSRLSEGIPYYLELLCKSYVQYMAKGGKEAALDESKYGLNKADIADRYLKRFSDNTKDLLKQLVTIEGGWNDEMLNAGVIKNFDKATHSKLIESSLVKYNRDTQKYSMPEPIRKVILEFVDSEVVDEVKKRLYAYFLDVVRNENASEGIGNIEQLQNYSTIEEKESIFSDLIIPRIVSYFDYYKMEEVQILLDEYREIFNKSSNKKFKANFLEMEGLYFKYKRDIKTALTKHEECYQLRKEELGENDHATLCSLSNIANCLDELGEYDEALERSLKCLEARINNPSDPLYEIIVSYNNTAGTLANDGKYDDALKIYKVCYTMEQGFFLKSNDVICSTLNGIAFCLERKQEYNEAIDWYNRCYEAVKEVYSENHPFTLLTLNGIACCHSGLGEDNEALEIYKKCYEIQKKYLGENHTDTLATYNNIANCFVKLGSLKDALDIYTKCYEIQRNELREGHPETLNSLHNLAYCHEKLGSLNEALEKYKEYYELQKNILAKAIPKLSYH